LKENVKKGDTVFWDPKAICEANDHQDVLSIVQCITVETLFQLLLVPHGDDYEPSIAG